MVNLDATAGNRNMWPNKTPPDTIFMDREYDLRLPPDIFGDFTRLPFRDNVFNVVIFDPPHYTTPPPWYDDPQENRHPKQGSFYGRQWSRRKMISSISKAQAEIARVSKRVCLRWYPLNVKLWNIVGLFRPPWREVHRVHLVRGTRGAGCWWITFSK